MGASDCWAMFGGGPRLDDGGMRVMQAHEARGRGTVGGGLCLPAAVTVFTRDCHLRPSRLPSK